MSSKLIGRAMWCGSGDAGNTTESVVEFVERAHHAGINTLVIEIKHGDGMISWPSKKFPQAVKPEYQEFDLPRVLLDECHKRGMQVHAWLIDFMEGEFGPAYREHPEWAMLDRKGNPTSHEILRGHRFGSVWMCPTQRPGYTDQWLVPMIRELAEMYDLDAIHHDYVRFPGDLAPDQYCFCDYCLTHAPKFNHLIADVYPEAPFYHDLYDREYLEAHWEQSPRVLPANWDKLPRHMKSDFLLKGSFFQGGVNDLDYFYYTYRSHWITDFTRLAAEAVRVTRPGMEISAAVFKNPIHSGRFIGQDWRTFAPFVEYCMPMDYRDHFPGTFDQYLGLLKATILRQKEWAGGYKHLWPGFAINFLYHEEEKPLRLMKKAAEAGDQNALKAIYLPISNRLKSLGGMKAHTLVQSIEAGVAMSKQAVAVDEFVNDVPKNYWPQDKVERVIETIRSAGVDGLTIFCAGQLSQYGAWETVRKSLEE